MTRTFYDYLAGLLSPSKFIPKLTTSQCENLTVFRVLSLDGAHTEELSLRELLRNRCPSLSEPFRPPWWLYSGHLQTIYGVIGKPSERDRIEYERVFLRTLDGGTLGLDFAPKHHNDMPAETPLVVVLHGLTGGSYETYVRSVLSVACKPKEHDGLGYRAVVVNFRGCAGVPLTNARIYSAATIEDISTALLYLSATYPKARLLGVGFSLGANVLTRYLAETGTKSRLASGCVLACPWNLSKNSERLESGFLSRNIYSKAMGKNLIALVRKHQAPLSCGTPESAIGEHLPLLLSGRSFLLKEVDEHLVTVLGGPSPPFPFESAEAYYSWASTDKLLPQIRTPFLAINAEDDPIVQDFPLDVGGEGYAAIAISSSGGHLGWFQKSEGSWMGVDRWVKRPVVEWLKVMGDSLIVEGIDQSGPEERDGFNHDRELEGVGYKVITGVVASGTHAEEGMIPGL